MQMNAFEWRTVAVALRGQLESKRPISTKRAQKIVAKHPHPANYVDLLLGRKR